MKKLPLINAMLCTFAVCSISTKLEAKTSVEKCDPNGTMSFYCSWSPVVRPHKSKEGNYYKISTTYHLTFLKADEYQFRVKAYKPGIGAERFLTSNDCPDHYVINGGFSSQNRNGNWTPSALIVLNGKLISRGALRVDGGIISINGRNIYITRNKIFPNTTKSISSLQTWPMLIFENKIDQHEECKSNKCIQYANRSAIGLTDNGYVVYVTSIENSSTDANVRGDTLVTFTEAISSKMKEDGVNLEYLINLDGGLSVIYPTEHGLRTAGNGAVTSIICAYRR